MKLPRFHLSTLLLLCVFCGACVGLWLRGGAWQRDYFLSYGDAQSSPQSASAKFTFNLEKARLLAFHDRQVYVFDILNRRLLSKKPSSLPYTIDEIFVQSDGKAVRIKAPYRFRPKERSVELADHDAVINFDGDTLRYILPDTPEPKFNETVRDMTSECLRSNRWWPDSGNYCYEEAYCNRDKMLIAFRIHGLDPICAPDLYDIEVGRGCDTTRFSFDGQQLAIGQEDGISVWRRTRSYGWKGYLELPLFWIAFVSLLALIAIFVRSLLRHNSP